MTVGTVTSANEGITSFGILTTNQSLLLQTTGTLTVAQVINAGTAAAVTLTPTSGDVIVQAGSGITAASITQTTGTTSSTYAGNLSAGTGGIQLTGNSFSLTGPISNSGSHPHQHRQRHPTPRALSGSGIIVKNGAGTLQLNGPLPGTLNLTVNAGTTTIPPTLSPAFVK